MSAVSTGLRFIAIVMLLSSVVMMIVAIAVRHTIKDCRCPGGGGKSTVKSGGVTAPPGGNTTAKSLGVAKPTSKPANCTTTCRHIGLHWHTTKPYDKASGFRIAAWKGLGVVTVILTILALGNAGAAGAVPDRGAVIPAPGAVLSFVAGVFCVATYVVILVDYARFKHRVDKAKTPDRHTIHLDWGFGLMTSSGTLDFISAVVLTVVTVLASREDQI